MRGENYLPFAFRRSKLEWLMLFCTIFSATLFASDPHVAIINEGDVLTHCLDTTALGGASPMYILNNCPDSGGESVEFTFDDENWCVTYEGTAIAGIDTACVILCSSNFVCDTTFLYITTLPSPPIHMDTVLINDTESVCEIEFPNIEGPFTFLENFCDGNSPQNVEFSITDRFCIQFKGVNPGVGRACLNGSNNFGSDFTYFDVFVRMPEPEFLSAEVEVGEIMEVCAEDLELFGENLVVTSLCEEAKLFNSSYSVDNNCFTVEGRAEGSDMVCFMICDDLNVCDTIELEVNVLNREVIPAPVVLSDEFDVIAGEETTLAVCANDELPTEVENTMSIIGIPNYGTASVNEEACGIIYTALEINCSQLDSVEYEICNSTGCDRAMLYVNIGCDEPEEELAVIGGFSPNGDDKNETLVVSGLDRYPDHTLTVFNRYGAKLMESKEYQSDWDGKWDGKDIPDGVYYYLLDTGEGQQSSGWFVVQR